MNILCRLSLSHTHTHSHERPVDFVRIFMHVPNPCGMCSLHKYFIQEIHKFPSQWMNARGNAILCYFFRIARIESMSPIRGETQHVVSSATRIAYALFSRLQMNVYFYCFVAFIRRYNDCWRVCSGPLTAFSFFAIIFFRRLSWGAVIESPTHTNTIRNTLHRVRTVFHFEFLFRSIVCCVFEIITCCCWYGVTKHKSARWLLSIVVVVSYRRR